MMVVNTAFDPSDRLRHLNFINFLGDSIPIEELINELGDCLFSKENQKIIEFIYTSGIGMLFIQVNNKLQADMRVQREERIPIKFNQDVNAFNNFLSAQNKQLGPNPITTCQNKSQIWKDDDKIKQH